MIGYSASVPWIRGESNIDFVNNWTKIIRNHTIKWGGDLRRVRDDLLQDQTFSPRGAFTFSDVQTSQTWGKDKYRERHRQLPARSAEPDWARPEHVLPGLSAVVVLRLCQRQVAGDTEADARPWRSLGVLSAGDSEESRRILEL